MSVDAYLGKADAYIAMGDVNMALQTLEEGYSRTGSESIKKRIEEISLQTAGEAELSRGRRKRMQKRLLISLILCLNCRILRSWDTICLRRITRKSVRHTDVRLIQIRAGTEIMIVHRLSMNTVICKAMCLQKMAENRNFYFSINIQRYFPIRRSAIPIRS